MAWFGKLWPFSVKASTEDVLRELYSGREVRSGVNVTYKTALEISTVLRCVSVLSDGVSTVPLRVFRKNGASRVPAEDHPLYDLFCTSPNPWQDSLQFRETVCFHLFLLGNAFVFINRVRGVIKELIPIEPSRVSVEQKTDFSIVYNVTLLDGRQVEFPQETIWHLRGPSWNSWMGLETVSLGRESIGLSAALERSHARLHKNGVRTSGAYSVEGTLDEKQTARLRNYITQELAGLDNAGRPLILDRSAKWQSLAMSGVDSEHLDTRKFQVEEICRVFNVMPIMAGYSDKTATYASAEQMFLAHNVYTIRPLHRRFEASIRKNLLTERERKEGYYAKFIDTEMLRGAAKDRAEYYRSGINAGWLMRNEAREWEELDPIDGLSEPLSPVNMVVGNPLPAQEPQAADPSHQDPQGGV